MDILIYTQYQENYGTETAPYWKHKGGRAVRVMGFTHPLNDGIRAAAQAVFESMCPRIEYSNPMSEEYIVDWELVESGTQSQRERDQMKLAGYIYEPDTRIVLESVI